MTNDSGEETSAVAILEREIRPQDKSAISPSGKWKWNKIPPPPLLPQNSLQKGCGLLVAWVSDSNLSISCFVLFPRYVPSPFWMNLPNALRAFSRPSLQDLSRFLFRGNWSLLWTETPSLHFKLDDYACYTSVPGPSSNLCTCLWISKTMSGQPSSQWCSVPHCSTANEFLVPQEIWIHSPHVKNELNCYLLHCCFVHNNIKWRHPLERK